MNWIIPALVVLGLASQSLATPLQPSTKKKMTDLRTSIKTWAPMIDGVITLSRDGYQNDMIEFAGYRCAAGEAAACDNIRKSQDRETGRWWRAPALIKKTKADSFSRDMFMGLMFYFGATKDRDSLDRWVGYLGSHRNKMCDDGTDNRCGLLLSNWGLFGYLYRHLGLRVSTEMWIGMKELSVEMLISALTAPKGFELALVADNIYFLRSIGVRKKWMDDIAKILYKRQPANPMFEYLVTGSTEELAKKLLAACPAAPSTRADDIFWQRQLGWNSKGELIVIRDDWGPQNSRIPVYEMADGHDCIAALNFAIDAPF